MDVDILLSEAPALSPAEVERRVIHAWLDTHPEIDERLIAFMTDDYSRPGGERGWTRDAEGRAVPLPLPATTGGWGGNGVLLTDREVPEPPNDRDGAMTRSEYEIAEFSDEDGAAIFLRVCLRTGYDARHMDRNLNLRAVRGLLPDEDAEEDADG